MLIATMVYNEKLEHILEIYLNGLEGITSKKMFGGIGFLLNGNMVVGVHKDYFIMRMGEKQAREAIKLKNVRLFDITGRPMKGWIMASENAFDNESLDYWLGKSVNFVNTLPPK